MASPPRVRTPGYGRGPFGHLSDLFGEFNRREEQRVRRERERENELLLGVSNDFFQALTSYSVSDLEGMGAAGARATLTGLYNDMDRSLQHSGFSERARNEFERYALPQIQRVVSPLEETEHKRAEAKQVTRYEETITRTRDDLRDAWSGIVKGDRNAFAMREAALSQREMALDLIPEHLQEAARLKFATETANERINVYLTQMEEQGRLEEGIRKIRAGKAFMAGDDGMRWDTGTTHAQRESAIQGALGVSAAEARRTKARLDLANAQVEERKKSIRTGLFAAALTGVPSSEIIIRGMESGFTDTELKSILTNARTIMDEPDDYLSNSPPALAETRRMEQEILGTDNIGVLPDLRAGIDNMLLDGLIDKSQSGRLISLYDAQRKKLQADIAAKGQLGASVRESAAVKRIVGEDWDAPLTELYREYKRPAGFSGASIPVSLMEEMHLNFVMGLDFEAGFVQTDPTTGKPVYNIELGSKADMITARSRADVDRMKGIATDWAVRNSTDKDGNMNTEVFRRNLAGVRQLATDLGLARSSGYAHAIPPEQHIRAVLANVDTLTPGMTEAETLHRLFPDMLPGGTPTLDTGEMDLSWLRENLDDARLRQLVIARRTYRQLGVMGMVQR